MRRVLAYPRKVQTLTWFSDRVRGLDMKMNLVFAKLIGDTYGEREV